MLRIVQHVLFTAMVVLGVMRSGLDGGVSPGEALAAIALLGWYWLGWWSASRWPQPSSELWLGVLSGLCLAAVWVSGDFAWVSFAVFVAFATTLEPGPAVAAIVVLAAGTGAILIGRWPSDGHWAAQVVGPVVGAAAAGALVGVVRISAAETTERQQLLDELLATRDDLARAHLEAGAREERERLTGEIHDTVAQVFTSVVLSARRARRTVDAGDRIATAAEIDHIEDLSRSGVDAARRLISCLGPMELDGRTLGSALELLAALDPRHGDPVVEIRVDGDDRRLPGAVEGALLRIAQEAVANARRHAGAELVVTTITFQTELVSLDVVDDGAGFDLTSAPPDRFGLATMRNRAEQVGGSFYIDSEPGVGTTVNATVPVDPAEPWS